MKNRNEITVTQPTAQILNLKRYIVRFDGYGTKVMLAVNTAQLLNDLQILRHQGVSVTIICEEKRAA